MKTTGIVRRVDAPGRITAPKEIRWTLGPVRKSDGRKYKIHALGSVIFPGRSARISQGQKEVDKRKTDDYNNMM